LLPIAVIGAVVVVVAVGASLQSGGSAPGIAPAVGHGAPDFALRDTSGRAVSLGSLRGRVVLLDFWATWCIPCRSEMPAIDRLYRDRPRQLAVLAVDRQEPVGDVEAFARRYGLAVRPLLDPTLAAWKLYGVSNVQPVSFWVDPNGVIRARHFGPMDGQFMRRELDRLLSG
jgi:peroxiredoxin